MATADGSIVFSIDLDDKKANQELNRLNRKIQSLNDKIYTSNQERLPLVAQAEELAARLDAAKAKLAEMKAASPQTAEKELDKLNQKIQALGEKIGTLGQEKSPLVEQSDQLTITLDAAKAKLAEMKTNLGKSSEEVKEQAERVRGLQSSWNTIQSQLERYDSSITRSNADLGQAQQRASELAAQLAQSYSSSQVREQEETVRALQTQWNNVQRQVERYDTTIQRSTTELDRAQARAGEIEQHLAQSGSATNRLARGIDGVNKRLDKFLGRIVNLAKRTFIFSMITASLRGIRTWFGNVIKTNDDAVKAIARLKGAFLTLAQPLVEVIIPAITTIANLLTMVVNAVASVLATLFGSTIEQSREAAKNLYEEADAIDETGKKAKKAEKSLAGFDEIQKLSKKKDTSKKDDKIEPEFSDVEKGWLKDILGDVAGWVTAATLLGGIALVAIGAATGSLGLVIAGLVLIGVGLAIGADTGVLQSWVDALGLNSVKEFVVLAILLAGITIVAIGAATGNILMVIAGLVLLGVTIAYVEKSGMLKDWADSLGLAKAAQYITAALMIAGFALVVIGAATGNVLMVIAGIALFAAGVYIGMKSGVLKHWWDVLGLNKAENFITAALLIGGIALTIFGIASGNILMFLAGLALIYAGYKYGKENGVIDEWWKKLNLDKYANHITAALMIGGMALAIFGIISGNIPMFLAGLALIYAGYKFGKEKGTIDKWWEKLNLDKYNNHITAALMIGGMALMIFGIITTNILMFIAGLALVYAGYRFGKEKNTLDTWWDALGLDNYANYITAALMIGAAALIVFGIITTNIVMILGGLVMLGAAANYSTKTGTSKTWWDALGLPKVPEWVPAAIMLAGVALIALGAATLNPLYILGGLGLLGVSVAAADITSGSSKKRGMRRGNMPNLAAMPSIASYSIPHLATGAVIPPNREFLAVLGDQKSGTNIEAPTSEIENAVIRGIQRAGGLSGGSHTAILEIDKRVLGRVMWEENKTQSSRMGVRIVQRANT